MKRKNTLWSLALALVMVLGVIAPLGALASDAKPKEETPTPDSLKVTLKETDLQGTKPEKTPVTIHKLQADKYANDIGIGFKHNGGKIPVNEGKYPEALGTNVKELDGVTFSYYKLSGPAQLKEFIANKDDLTTDALVQQKLNVNAPTGTIKTEKSQGATVELEDGYYWFVESKYDKPEGGPDITSSIAVPFGLSIPVMNKEKVGKYDIGTGYLKEVHVYPKNVTGKDSVPTKTVANEVNMNAKYDIGQLNTWYLQATIPANIQDYETFKMVDTFFKGLTYKGNVEVYMGYDGAKDAGKSVALVKGEDYTLVEPTVDTKFATEMPADLTNFDPSNKPDFSVTLTDKGLKKLVDNYQTVKTNADGKDVKLYAKVDTAINEEAKIATKIKNTYDLITKIKGKDEKKKKPDTPPSVETGGKKFIKVSASDDKVVLEDAVFALYDEVKKPEAKTAAQLTWTADLIKANEAAINAGNFATKADDQETYTATSASNKPVAGKPIYLRSNAQGLFEIKGLEYSKWTKTLLDKKTEEHEHNYYLMEVKFPENYAGNKDTKFAFTIDENSYNGTAKSYPGEKLKDGAMMVENKDLTIPPTGGMGTVIFVVAGLALMGGAFIAMRKRSAEQA